MHIKTREALLSAPGLHPRGLRLPPLHSVASCHLSVPWVSTRRADTPAAVRPPPSGTAPASSCRGARRDHSPLHPTPGPTQGQLSPCGPPDELAERGGQQAGTQQQCFPLGGAWSSWHLHSALSVIPTMAIRTLRLWEACWGPGVSETGQPWFTLCTKIRVGATASQKTGGEEVRLHFNWERLLGWTQKPGAESPNKREGQAAARPRSLQRQTQLLQLLGPRSSDASGAGWT